MENHHNHHSNGFMNGFLFGAIIGAALVFFLFTDKGKKLLKTITEEGMEEFSNLKDLVEDEMNDEDEEYEDSPLPPVPHRSEHSRVEPLHTPGKAKRFFRGIKRG